MSTLQSRYPVATQVWTDALRGPRGWVLSGLAWIYQNQGYFSEVSYVNGQYLLPFYQTGIDFYP